MIRKSPINILPQSACKLTVLKVWDEFVQRRAQMDGWIAECAAKNVGESLWYPKRYEN